MISCPSVSGVGVGVGGVFIVRVGLRGILAVVTSLSLIAREKIDSRQ